MERERDVDLMRGRRFLKLRVRGVWMIKDRVFFSNSGKRSCFKYKIHQLHLGLVL